MLDMCKVVAASRFLVTCSIVDPTVRVANCSPGHQLAPHLRTMSNSHKTVAGRRIRRATSSLNGVVVGGDGGGGCT